MLVLSPSPLFYALFATSHFGVKFKLRDPPRSLRLGISFGLASRTTLTEVDISVAVATDHEPAFYLNFDTASARPQVEVRFIHDIACNAITCVGRVFTLRSGEEFIRSILHQTMEYLISDLIPHEPPFLGGRLSWDSMFMETFGTAAENLLKPSSWMTGPCPTGRPKTESGCFVYLFVAYAQYCTFCTTESVRYGSAQEFILTATNQVPELKPLKEELEELLLADTATEPRRSDIESKLGHARHDLRCVCRCAVHSQGTARFCSVALAGTILKISCMLGHISIEASLRPRRSGILATYSHLQQRFDSEEQSGDNEGGCAYLSNLMIPRHGLLRQTFTAVMVLFSGERPAITLAHTVSALSDGRIYCLVDTVRQLSDRFDRASVVRVGIGSIQVGHRLHYKVCEPRRGRDWITEGYEPGRLETVVGDIPSVLSRDTTSPELQVEAVVEDSLFLCFWYRLRSRKGHILISPAAFVEDYLSSAIAYREIRDIEAEVQTQRFQVPDFDACGQHVTSIAHGEGVVPRGSNSASKILLRPHGDNLLGRCAALATSVPPVAIISNRETDLKFFAAAYQAHFRSDNAGSWTLI